MDPVLDPESPDPDPQQQSTPAPAVAPVSTQTQPASPAQPSGPKYKTPADAIAADAHGDDFLETLPPMIAYQVKAYADGRKSWPTGMAMSKPEMLQMQMMVGQYDPTLDQTNWNLRSKTRTDYGPGGKVGQQNNNINTAVDHVQHLALLGDGLHNQGWPWVNWIVNPVRVGFGGSPVTNFRQNAGLASEELTKAYRGTGGAEADVKRHLQDYNENMSPEQLNGAVATTAGLLQDKANQTQKQYDEAMGAQNHGLKVLTPEHQAILDSLRMRDPDERERLRSERGGVLPSGPPSGTPISLPKGNGQVIDKATAQKFYSAAGNDPKKAQQLAQDSGWKIQ